MKSILILTDSRGIHKPSGSTHDIYAERLAKTAGVKVTAYCCPYKWTTTLDLLSLLDQLGAENFDHVILHAGIVDHSPRPVSSMMNQLIDPIETTSDATAKAILATRDFRMKRIVNRKRPLLEALFGKVATDQHFATPFETQYEGDFTINLYSLEMLKKSLLPRLQAIQNLIFISSNTLCRNWRGDYPKDRPENIYMTEDYSRTLCEGLGQVVNLHEWNEDQVRQFTCDNMHLTKDGSDWIYHRLLEELNVREPENNELSAPLSPTTPVPRVSVVVPVYNVERWLEECIASIRAQSLKDIEIILVDDGSTDNCAAICKKAVAEDPRCKYVYQKNGGLGPARNTGVSVSTGNYITFVDSDDTIHPDYCSKLYNTLVTTKSDLASCMFQKTDEEGNKTQLQENFITKSVKAPDGSELTDVEKILGFYSSSTAHCRMFKRHLFSDDKLRFPERLPHEDWFFTYKAFMYASKTCQVEEPLYFWRTRVGSLSNTATESHIEAPLLLIDDTEATLKVNNVSERERNYADRRSIYALAIIYGRVCGKSPELKARMIGRVVDYLPKITAIFQRADREIVERPMLLRVARLIEEASASKLDRIFSANAPFLAVKEKFRNAQNDKDRVLSFRNAFPGGRCFIIGNGPSLNNHDLDLLKDEYTFAVNSFFLKTRDTGFCPTFYVVEDSKVMEENVDDIRAFPAPFKFFPEDYRDQNLANESTCHFKMNWDFYFTSRPYYGIPRFSAAMHDNIFAGQTVTFANMQMAFYMGFTEVYLIGMDFDYFIPPEHKITGNHILSTTDDPNHFHKDYFGVGKTWKNPQLDRVAVSYRQAKLCFEAAGRNLYNATVGGKLEIFDRVDYAALLKDPVTGKKRRERIAPTVTSVGGAAKGTLLGGDQELQQLRENFKSLSAHASDLEQRLKGSRPLLVNPQTANPKLPADDADGARMLLTSLGSGWIVDPAKAATRLASDTKLRDAVQRALTLLPEADAHRQQYLRVCERFAPKASAVAAG